MTMGPDQIKLDQQQRQALLRERAHQISLRAILRQTRVSMAGELLPDRHGVRRRVLRSPYLTPPDDEVPVSVIVAYIERLEVQEALADQRVRLLTEQLGFESS